MSYQIVAKNQNPYLRQILWGIIRGIILFLKRMSGCLRGLYWHQHPCIMRANSC